MDYPKSVPNIGLVNGRFVDENPASGAPGSLIPAVWGNGVTQEILSVVQAAGLTPEETTNDQLLGALRSPALFLTAAQFDKSRSVATAEFVQRALGSYASARGVSAATQLSIADVGCSIGMGGTVSYTVTLPDVASVPDGASIGLHCRNSAPVTVASKSGAQISPQGAYLTSIVMNSGESANFVKESGIWTVYGTASLKYAALFSGMVSNPGYQKHASGNIDQWGTGISNAEGDVYVTFAMTFPKAYFSLVATHTGGDAAMVAVTAYSAKGCTLRIRNAAGQVSAGWSVNYFAKGY
ncbi:phage tail protein [Pseudomonas siliginis]|uniref:Phage tail protein n=1 Tax=Pseudomonas siliginis TaxID=2842346 RepID=A0ABY5CIC7_9PSED|nr:MULTISPECIES: phage tail protein [Pseudomonas]MEB2652056.1 phage tail protein [Pseudomonas siliginis]UST75574.1 phage tail protein [Pseudomonas siliginis]UST86185.1 phage tail protein [Pseudomonas siliginis]UVL95604.1 phage tail protein [Pseudomonas siliginis]VVP41908.1 hypothetical protein PS865_04903 [Pseudomonas fluorescens]